MAQTNRKTIPVNVSGKDEARELLSGLCLALEPQLVKRYGSRFKVEVGEMYDSGKLAESITGQNAPTNEPVVLRHTISFYRGWLRGAAMSIVWDSTRPQELVVTSEATSKLEDQAMMAFAMSSAALFAIGGFLSIRFRLLAALGGGVLGCALGMGMYYVIGNPIIAVLQGNFRRTNQLFALELASSAKDWIGETQLVPSPAESAPAIRRPGRPITADKPQQEPVSV